MTSKSTYSICGMCTVRCPIQVHSKNGQVTMIRGNPHVPAMKGAVCSRGAAGMALLNDPERPQTPLIRAGARGEGKWRRVSWDGAFDFVSQRLGEIRKKYGARAIALSDRGGPFRDIYRAWLRGIGSPNYVNHDSSCALNVQHAALSLMGLGRKNLVYDYKNARHVVLQFRNIFESIDVQEVNNLMDALEQGCRLTVIDIRATITAGKATRFMLIRPGSDYAFNLAVIHELLTHNLYDRQFAQKYILGLEELEQFIQPYTPEWSREQTGIPAESLRSFVRELARAKPAVLWHPGWMVSRYLDSFYLCRSIYIINALLGSIGAQGGLPLAAKPTDVGAGELKQFMDLFPNPEDKRADGAGWRYPHFETGPGVAHLLYQAMASGDPYPVKGYIAYRHDPLTGFPDPDSLREIFNHLDLLISVTFSWSDTAWFSDVVLPLSTYLERESILATQNALKPYFFVRHRATQPRYDTKADWEIVSGLARRLGPGELAFDRIEDIWRFQLEGTGLKIEDFNDTGMVQLTDQPQYRDVNALKFKTPSGRIELISAKLEEAGLPSLKPYTPPQQPPAGKFRLTFGRCAMHTQGHTVNNPLLFEQIPENLLWINTDAARTLGITSGDRVRVSRNGYAETIAARVTDLIHPEAVFVLHGFGHRLPTESRALGRGLADHKFMHGGLRLWDPAGGAIAGQEHFVEVSKV